MDSFERLDEISPQFLTQEEYDELQREHRQPRIGQRDRPVRERLRPDIEILNFISKRGLSSWGLELKRRFLFARAFLYSTDSVRKTFLQLCPLCCASDPARAALEAIDARIPDLKSVRDSTAHADERIQRKAGKQSIIPKAIDDAKIKAASGSLMMSGCLAGDEYTSTGADGRLASIPINRETLDTLFETAQTYVDALRWFGPPHLLVRV